MRAKDAKRRLTEAEHAKQLATSELSQINSCRPGFFARLFRLRSSKAWTQSYLMASDHLRSCSGLCDTAKFVSHKADEDEASHDSQIKLVRSRLQQEAAKVKSSKGRLEELSAFLDGVPIDDAFFGKPHGERQLTAPWLGREVSRVRDDLFETAMGLHKAFVDCAARPMRHNLGLLMDSFGTRSLGTPEKDAFVPDLWATLFLLVPVVSTTFASVSRMFCRMPANSLGWLLIDEAGQALPQAAIGAVMRAERVVAVGDPIQIEPVVMLPEQLTETICREFRVDETKFNAPSASAQTLADSATAYFSSFETKLGSRDVGVPLLVHRRCADPMFPISNGVAYENMMVQAKAQKRSRIVEVLGPSRWLSVSSSGSDKWSPEEGDVVVDMLRTLRAAEVEPDIYLVTPFVVVQDRLRAAVRASGVLDGWVQNPSRWPYDRVGTVHTVQGREAEAVFFVLGAPNFDQAGARNWAGGRPNLLNVAVSRAKEGLYVIGNRDLWREAGVFADLASRL